MFAFLVEHQIGEHYYFSLLCGGRMKCLADIVKICARDFPSAESFRPTRSPLETGCCQLGNRDPGCPAVSYFL
ncbi:hypothetical protein DUNSADRAFT_5807 [Dunaliella salina]|uniref:Encoded protein n=1 Tax=Dunaliella salina TaxID=3046 RepID=A0ABQ7FU24_DUNSA|nr:hypothetical protein DUNSADRAFT_5807 [Dunaliella salina]|eukprot:KAF5825939.1 hypothetical protein DUNSADRAFT_5807 [Dunaliella salina]